MHMKQHAGRCMRLMEPHIDRKGIEMDYKSGWSCKPVWLQSLEKCLQIELLFTRKCLLYVLITLQKHLNFVHILENVDSVPGSDV
jgi:hypothetical protein